LKTVLKLKTITLRLVACANQDAIEQK